MLSLSDPPASGGGVKQSSSPSASVSLIQDDLLLKTSVSCPAVNTIHYSHTHSSKADLLAAVDGFALHSRTLSLNTRSRLASLMDMMPHLDDSVETQRTRMHMQILLDIEKVNPSCTHSLSMSSSSPFILLFVEINYSY